METSRHTVSKQCNLVPGQKLARKQAHYSTHWLCVQGLAALTGVAKG